MALIACPECTKSVSDSAPACIHCGHPIGALAFAGVGAGASAGALNVRVASTPTALACPRCQCEDTRKLSMIWREGTSDINTRSSGVGIGGGGLGVGAAKTKGTAQTLASQGAAPPERQGIIKPAVVAFFALGLTAAGFSDPEIVAVSVIAALVLALCAWMIWSRLKFNREIYPVQMRRWEHSFRCQRCEHVFEVA